MRATRILTQRPDRAVLALAELCREREDELHRAPRSSSPAPRSMSTSGRGAYGAGGGSSSGGQVHNAAWRSHSQAAPFDRLGPPTPMEGGGRGRQSDGDVSEYSAQDLWLSSQGSNLGGVGSLGLQGFEPAASGSGGSSSANNSNGRGRDTQARGLETPGAGYRGARRAVSAYDDGAGSGSISAPLSPHRLYAQLEMGKGPQIPQSSWPSAMMNYDPRQHSTAGMPVSSASQRGQPRSASLVPGSRSIGEERDVPSSLPTFAPFSPAAPTSSLKPLNGEPAAYISPSTLLSPPSQSAALPSGNAGNAIDSLANNFNQLGVSPPGAGAENPAGARVAEVKGAKASSKSGSGVQSPTKKPTI